MNKPQKANKELAHRGSNERLLALTFLLIGTIGYIISMYSMTFREKPKDPLGLLGRKQVITVSTPTQPVATEVPASTTKFIGKQLLISGIREATESVKFTIENYDSKAKYQLSFGDGSQRTIKQQTAYHHYAKPGDYQVKLKVTYQGETHELFNEPIRIMKPIMVSLDADKFDF